MLEKPSGVIEAENRNCATSRAQNFSGGPLPQQIENTRNTQEEESLIGMSPMRYSN